MFVVDYAKNPTWCRDNENINLIVKFSHLKKEVPFTASASDPHEHGKNLHKRAVNGEFGQIKEFVDTTPKKDLEKEARLKRNALLQQIDWTQLPDVPQSTKEKWSEYRQLLRDIPQQPNFPHDIEWPRKP